MITIGSLSPLPACFSASASCPTAVSCTGLRSMVSSPAALIVTLISLGRSACLSAAALGRLI
jgi:hypothetical protein